MNATDHGDGFVQLFRADELGYKVAEPVKGRETPEVLHIDGKEVQIQGSSGIKC